MIGYVMDELHDYAKLVDEATGIEVSGSVNRRTLLTLSRSLVSMGPGSLTDLFQIRY